MTVAINPPAALLGRVHAIMTGRARQHYVRFAGPTSIKYVLRGNAAWESGGMRRAIDNNSYLLLNDGTEYDMTIDSNSPVETFCIFFARGFLEDCARTHRSPAELLLDDPEAATAHGCSFYETIYPFRDAISREIQAVRGLVASGADEPMLESGFVGLAHALMGLQEDVRKQVEGLDAARSSTRQEVFRRVCRGRDYIESYFDQPLSLERIARAACMSSFHFHREFRRAFGETPHQYLQRKRLEKARALLASGDSLVLDVCISVGFESVTSFTHLFRRYCGCSPARFRQSELRKSKTR